MKMNREQREQTTVCCITCKLIEEHNVFPSAYLLNGIVVLMSCQTNKIDAKKTEWDDSYSACIETGIQYVDVSQVG